VFETGNYASETIIDPTEVAFFSGGLGPVITKPPLQGAILIAYLTRKGYEAYQGASASSSKKGYDYYAAKSGLSSPNDPALICDGRDNDCGGVVDRACGDMLLTWPSPKKARQQESAGFTSETYRTMTDLAVEGELTHLAGALGAWVDDIRRPTPFDANDLGAMLGVVSEVLDRAAAARDPNLALTPVGFVEVLERQRVWNLMQAQCSSRGGNAPIRIRKDTMFIRASFFDILSNLTLPGPDCSPASRLLHAGTTSTCSSSPSPSTSSSASTAAPATQTDVVVSVVNDTGHAGFKAQSAGPPPRRLSGTSGVPTRSCRSSTSSGAPPTGAGLCMRATT